MCCAPSVRVVETGYGERDAETAAVAAPVFGAGNKLMGALSISGPRYRLEATSEARIVPVLFQFAKQLTTSFGGNVRDPTLAGWNAPVAGAAATRAGAGAKSGKRVAAGARPRVGAEPSKAR
jgi:hypothetical protein